MKCANCGFDYSDGAVFCPNCGIKIEAFKDETVFEEKTENFYEQNDAEPTNENIFSFRDKVGAMLKSGLFLTLCILVSISAGFGIISKQFPILEILATIFLWLVFTKAKKNQLDVKNMRCLSGVIFAEYVIGWVWVGVFSVLGAIWGFAFSYIDFENIKSFLPQLINELENKGVEVEFNDLFSQLNNPLTMIGIRFLAVVFIIIAVILALLNIFSIGKIHKFTKTLYLGSAQNDEGVVKCVKGAASWLLVIGIITAISALGWEDYTLICTGARAAACIVASILIKRNFKNNY